jgi:hypothetical protein
MLNLSCRQASLIDKKQVHSYHVTTGFLTRIQLVLWHKKLTNADVDGHQERKIPTIDLALWLEKSNE